MAIEIETMTTRTIPLGERDAVRQARLLRALADPTRLRILSLLARYDGKVCVYEICECFELKQPTISHHLRILQDSGLIDGRKHQLFVYYSVCQDALDRARAYIEALTGSKV